MIRQDWPTQKKGVSETIARLEAGVSSLCLTSPTGGGKSLMMQRLCEWAVSNGKQVSVLTNRKLLTNQLANGLASGGIHVGVRAADFEAWTDPNAPVQICSVQTELSRVIGKRKKAVEEQGMSEGLAEAMWGLHQSELVLIDEVHLNKGNTVCGMIDEFKGRYGAQIVGVSATPLGVSHICSELVIAGNNSDLRSCGALVPAMCYEPGIFDLPKIRRSKTGLFTQSEANEAVKAIWSQHVVGHIYDHWKELNPNAKPTLGMAPGRKESLGLATDFHKRGVNAAHICSSHIFINGKQYTTNEQKDRDEIFAMSKDGRCPIIFNRFVLREAIDLPWLEHLILATPIASLLSYIQTVGRVLRASPQTGKTQATISDHGGSIRLHGSPNLDRDQDWKKYFHENDASKITRDRVEGLRDPAGTEKEPIVCPKCQSMRKTGSKCPMCGFEHQASVRLVIQETGKLKKIVGDFFPKRRVETRTDTEKLWASCYYRCKNAKRPMTFNQARALFVKTHGYTPPANLPLMPKSVMDWSRKIASVPMSDVHRAQRVPDAVGLFDRGDTR